MDATNKPRLIAEPVGGYTVKPLIRRKKKKKKRAQPDQNSSGETKEAIRVAEEQLAILKE